LGGRETFPQVSPHWEKNQLNKVYKFNDLESTLNYIKCKFTFIIGDLRFDFFRALSGPFLRNNPKKPNKTERNEITEREKYLL